jgi:hypothetical protein
VGFSDEDPHLDLIGVLTELVPEDFTDLDIAIAAGCAGSRN